MLSLSKQDTPLKASMAELVDALDSKSGYRKVVQVRFLFGAQKIRAESGQGKERWLVSALYFPSALPGLILKKPLSRCSFEGSAKFSNRNRAPGFCPFLFIATVIISNSYYRFRKSVDCRHCGAIGCCRRTVDYYFVYHS